MENMKKNNMFKNKSINTDDLDSMLKNYISSTSIPEEQTRIIFDKIDNNKSNNKSKSIIGLIFLHLPTLQESILKSLYFCTISALLFLNNYPVNESSDFNSQKRVQSSSDNKKITTILNKNNPIIKSQSYPEINESIPENKKNEAAILNISQINDNLISYPAYEIKTNTSKIVTNPISIISENLQFSYEFKINKFNNLTYHNQKAPEEAILKDFSFGLWYDINPNLMIGLEFRQESFTLRNYAESNPNKNIYTQNMNCWEIGFRFLSDVSILESKPYLQLNLGGGNLGMVSRLSAGFTIPVTNEFNIITGAEINSLIYNSSNKIHSTERIGFNIGFNLDLK